MSTKKQTHKKQISPIGQKPLTPAPSGTLPSGTASASAASPGGATPPSTPATASTAQPLTTVARDRIKSRALFVNAMSALVAGLSNNFAPTAVFDLPSGTYTVEALAAMFTKYFTLVNRLTAAEQAYHLAVESEQAGSKATLALRAQLKAAIESRVGKTSSAMASYGFVPAKVPVRTAKSKMTAVIRGEATRTARGTMGARQKEAIKGNVTGVEVTPILAPGASGSAPK